ncbi:MAG TPA: hypothetical protein VNV66_18100, partial [Pilimelia sp.]|nr:hypothetical protein [Pilimelia sp.]
MTHSSQPGPARSAGDPPDNSGHGKRASSYGEASDGVIDGELVTSPGHGAVAVFQAPTGPVGTGPAPARAMPARTRPALPAGPLVGGERAGGA